MTVMVGLWVEVLEGWVYDVEWSVANLLVRSTWSIVSPYLPEHVLFVNVCMPPYPRKKSDTIECTLPQSFLLCLVLSSCRLQTCLAFSLYKVKLSRLFNVSIVAAC
jgi:hypothetical protein